LTRLWQPAEKISTTEATEDLTRSAEVTELFIKELCVLGSNSLDHLRVLGGESESLSTLLGFGLRALGFPLAGGARRLARLAPAEGSPPVAGLFVALSLATFSMMRSNEAPI
jgi:hypothetical protein